MKAMLLAAGKGERMMPLTASTPKPLLRAGGKPLIEWHLHRLAGAGVAEVVINHAWQGARIESELGDGSRFGLGIHYSAEGEPLETAGGIHRALPLLGDEPFLVISADIWTEYCFTQLLQLDLRDDLLHLVMVPNAPHHPGGDFVLQGDRLALAADCAGEQTCTYSGIGVYSPELFAGLQPGFHALRPLLDKAISGGRAGGQLFTGEWRDIGTPERLAELDAWLQARP